MPKNSDPSNTGSRFPGSRGLVMREPTVFDRSTAGRIGCSLRDPGVPPVEPSSVIPAELLREGLEGFPEVSEAEAVRHFIRLSQWNYGVDTGPYPLGSCTMKYNPKINEWAALLEGFKDLHPMAPEELIQGALQLMFDLAGLLEEISGMDRVTLQPAAGAHGELTGMLMIRAYHASHGNPRSKVLIPDTAHGTNPASCSLANYRAVQIKSGPDGLIDPAEVDRLMDEEVAAIMVTNPNTLGLFESRIQQVAEIVHSRGGLVYCDGANLNAIMGITRPGDFGADVLHFNLHKTFSTPHGGGGPGSGPVGVTKALEPFLPVPIVVKDGDRYRLDLDQPDSIGKVRSFYGNFGVMVRAYAYIRELGAKGIKHASQMAVLNANYIKECLKEHFHLPYDAPCMHECVFSEKELADLGVKTMDLAKRLMDYGFHPPTVYFPLVVKGAIMIEPTETESKHDVDQFCGAMIAILKEAEQNPELLTGAPHKTRVGRLDEVKAVKDLKVRWTPEDD